MPILIFYIINPPLFLSTIFFLYLLHNQVLPQNIKGHHSMLMWKRRAGELGQSICGDRGTKKAGEGGSVSSSLKSYKAIVF